LLLCCENFGLVNYLGKLLCPDRGLSVKDGSLSTENKNKFVMKIEKVLNILLL